VRLLELKYRSNLGLGARLKTDYLTIKIRIEILNYRDLESFSIIFADSGSFDAK
jgi:hypothetical protein